MALRGIRGATTADANESETIVAATQQLLEEMIRVNSIDPEEVALAYFTTTVDLNEQFPALAARRLGWSHVPLLCGHEMEVPTSNPLSIERCIRVVILYNTERPASQMQFVYQRGALAIRHEVEQMRDALKR